MCSKMKQSDTRDDQELMRPLLMFFRHAPFTDCPIYEVGVSSTTNNRYCTLLIYFQYVGDYKIKSNCHRKPLHIHWAQTLEMRLLNLR